jgi:hypothetical protein
LTGSAKLGQKLLDSWGATLKPASFRGHLCFGPNQGQNVRFTRPDRWLPNWQAVNPDQAMREVTRRYLSAYGPASYENYERWLGISTAEVKRLFNSLGEEVSLVEIGGTSAWMVTEEVAQIVAATPSNSVRLLPGFDPYVIGAARDETAILPAAFKERVYRAQGWISPVLLVNGRMAGIWQHNQKGSRVEVQIEPFEDSPQWVRQASETEAERLAAFLGKKLELSWQA